MRPRSLRLTYFLFLIACGGASVADLAAPDGSSPDPLPTGSSTASIDAAPPPPPPPPPPRDAAPDAEVDAGSDVLDGLCDETAFSQGVLDGDCVYVFAELETSTAPRNVILLPERPGIEVAAFPLAASPDLGATGRLLYRSLTRTDAGVDAELREFKADPWDAGPIDEYPVDALANDPLVATPACPNASTAVALFPDDHTSVYSCRGEAKLYAEATAQMLFDVSIGELRALGRGRTALIGGGLVIRDSAGKDTAVVGIPPGGTFVAARSEGAGFAVALRFISSGKAHYRLFSITAAGAAADLGELSLGPYGGMSRAVMDSQGRVHGIVWRGNHYEVVRFERGAAPVVRFDESKHRARIVSSPWALLTSP